MHCKKEKFDIYIGRPGPWGNPFPLEKEEDRQEVIDQYRSWLLQEISSGRIQKEKILALRGKSLGCWCAPKACHGDVLLEIAEKIQEEIASPREAYS